MNWKPIANAVLIVAITVIITFVIGYLIFWVIEFDHAKHLLK